MSGAEARGGIHPRRFGAARWPVCETPRRNTPPRRKVAVPWGWSMPNPKFDQPELGKKMGAQSSDLDDAPFLLAPISTAESISEVPTRSVLRRHLENYTRGRHRSQQNETSYKFEP